MRESGYASSCSFTPFSLSESWINRKPLRDSHVPRYQIVERFMCFVSEIVMEEEFENPYMGPAMMTGAEVGFAWARMNRNSMELDRICSFAAGVGRDEFFDGVVDWASRPEGFLAMIYGNPIPTETDPDYEEQMAQLRSVADEFWMALLYRCGVPDNSCLGDPYFYDGFLEGAVAITDPDYSE